jgi:hypothetical protein
MTRSLNVALLTSGVLLLISGVSGVNLEPPFILSVTASGDDSKQNRIIAFDAHNVSHQFANEEFRYYESALCSSYDKSGARYFVLLEGAIAVFSTKNLTETALISYAMPPGSSYPDTMHFDSTQNLLWLLTSPSYGVMQFCSTPATFNSSTTSTSVAKLTCHEPLSDAYDYTTDSSAFDRSTSTIWVGLDKALPEKGHVLVGFNVATKENVPAVPIKDLCQNMEVIQIDSATTLACVHFSHDELVQLDSTTGKTKNIHDYPAIHSPEPYSSTVVAHADGKSSSYFTLLFGDREYSWIEIDVKSGKKVASTEIATKSLPGHLALSQYIY